jgi:hypothetical protein
MDNAFRESDLLAMSKNLNMFEDKQKKEKKAEQVKENYHSEIKYGGRNVSIPSSYEMEQKLSKGVLTSKIRNYNDDRDYFRSSQRDSSQRNYRESLNKLKKVENKLKHINLSQSNKSILKYIILTNRNDF